MAFDTNRMLVNRVPREVNLSVKLKCSHCNSLTDSKGECASHDGGVEPVPVKVIDISWARLNQIKSQCAIFNSKENSSHFDTQVYFNTCLQEMVVEAPWGETNTMFLLQVGHELGNALEKIAPSLEEDSDAEVSEISPEEIKKV